MKTSLKSLIVVLSMAFVQNVFAQAPNISYGTGTVSITPGTVSIQPTNSGGTVPGNQYFQVSTFAGSNSGLAGTVGYINGTGTTALFNDPRDMAFDVSGNLYVADAGNNAIRKITPAGVVTTFAGSPTGAAGSADGTGTSALFNLPDGLVFDNSGNLFVSDYNNHAIREITPAGVVSTWYQGNPSFFNPTGMCFDMWGQLLIIIKNNNLEAEIVTPPNDVVTNNAFTFGAIYSVYADIKPDISGNLYITDANRNEIVKLNELGVLSGEVLAGNYNATTFNLNGAGTNATFTQPTGIQVMADGTAYVADLKNNDIRKIAPDGTVSLLAGYVPLNGSGFPTQQPGYVDGAIANAQFNQPAYIRADNNGNLYISEWGAGGNRIRKMTLSGFFLSGPQLPGGLQFDSATGNISGTLTKKISVVQTDTVTAVNASGTSVATITFMPGTALQAPHISYASTNITAGVPVTLIPQNTGGAVPAIAYGTVSSFAGNSADQAGYINGQDTTIAHFNFPQTMEMDAAGNLYVADAVNNGIRKISPTGYVTTFAGALNGFSGSTDGTGNAAYFNYPDGTAMDSIGNLYVADYKNNAIRKITPARVVTTIYSTTNTFGPGGMCFDKSGNLLVSAQDANQIWKITLSGVATVLTGSTTAGYVNGDLSLAKFYEPTDVKVDTAGNIYVADFKNNVIRKITPSGIVTLLAGDTSSNYSGYANGNKAGFANGKGAAAIFNNPAGIVIAPGGVLYVTDFYNNAIRRIMPDGTVGLVAGTPSVTPGLTNGVGTAAGFSAPDYMYMDDTGTGYIAEGGGERIRKVVLTGYSLTGTLPTGLSFDPATGIISGTPTGPLTKHIDTITAYNASGYSTTIITLPPSNIATLANLVPNEGVLSPAFASATTSYADSVSTAVAGITLTPTTTDSTATVTVNGTTVASGTASGNLTLAIGDNNITVVVTAQDGVTTDTYTVDVYRGAVMGSLAATNILTPNGDGKNDFWEVKDIQLYPQNNVNVFDQGGKTVFAKHGYNNDWDGTYNGKPLPQGTYYYVVDLGPNLRKFKGFISILKN